MLKPCPFCGSSDLTHDEDEVECQGCNALGPADDPSGSKWNKRHQTIASTNEIRRAWGLVLKMETNNTWARARYLVRLIEEGKFRNRPSKVGESQE